MGGEKILLANLKHLYQHWICWALYLALTLFFVVAMTEDAAGAGIFWCCVLGNFMTGLSIARLQTDIMTKPLTFCLPGYQAGPRAAAFVLAGVFNLPLAVLIFTIGGRLTHTPVIVLLSSLSAGFGLYFLIVGGVVGMTLGHRLCSGIALAVACLLYIPLLWADTFSSGQGEHAILDWAEIFLAVGPISCVIAWRCLRFDTLTREHIAAGIGQVASLVASRRKIKYASSASKVEEFFLSRMSACAGSRLVVTSVWGSLYVAFARLFARWKVIGITIIVASVLLARLAGWTKDIETGEPATILQQMLSVFLCVVVAFLPLALDWTMVLPAGRKERFVGTIAIALAASALSIAAMMAVTAVTLGLGALWPSFFGRTQIMPVLSPLAFVPLTLVFRLLSRNRVMSSAIMATVLVWFALPFIAMQLMSALHLTMTVQVTIYETIFRILFAPIVVLFEAKPLPTCVLAIIAWSALVFLTHRICTKWSLVKPRARA